MGTELKRELGFYITTPPPGGSQIRDQQSPGPALGPETQNASL